MDKERFMVSDLRLKKNIDTFITRPIDVTWCSFEYRDDPKGRRLLGAIAQALEIVHPEFVITDPDTGFKAIDKISLLIAKNAELEERIKALENK